MTYTPRQITETDEPTWSDCTGASMLMQADAWTFGELFLDQNGQRLSDDEIHTLREVIRPGPSNDASGSNPADWDGWIRRIFPEILHIPSWDNADANLRESWPFYLKAWQSDHCGVLQGNPSHVKDPASKLRRWTNNDDFGHCVYVDRADALSAFIKDPLAPRGYAGNWVSLTELRQYAYVDGSGWVYGSLVIKGDQSMATLNAKIAQLTADLAQCSKERATAQKRVVELRADLATAKTAVSEAQTSIADLIGQLTTCKSGEELVACQASLATEQAALDESLAAEQAALAARDALQARVDAAMAALQAAA